MTKLDPAHPHRPSFFFFPFIKAKHPVHPYLILPIPSNPYILAELANFCQTYKVYIAIYGKS